ncbi:hypothetical protein M1585_03410 [Candidatus Parvarchaeota archaeon]|nr:hypothetical protein [Candidatus Parvarchaeota archaeon]
MGEELDRILTDNGFVEYRVGDSTRPLGALGSRGPDKIFVYINRIMNYAGDIQQEISDQNINIEDVTAKVIEWVLVHENLHLDGITHSGGDDWEVGHFERFLAKAGLPYYEMLQKYAKSRFYTELL